jgi:hypothetical protein
MRTRPFACAALVTVAALAAPDADARAESRRMAELMAGQVMMDRTGKRPDLLKTKCRRLDGDSRFRCRARLCKADTCWKVRGRLTARPTLTWRYRLRGRKTDCSGSVGCTVTRVRWRGKIDEPIFDGPM